MTPYYADDLVTIYHGDAIEIAPQLERYCEIAARRCSQEVLGLTG